MNTVIQLPEDVAQTDEVCVDLSQYALRSLAVKAYRSGILTSEQLHRVLSLRNRLECGSFLQEDYDNDLKILKLLPQA